MPGEATLSRASTVPWRRTDLTVVASIAYALITFLRSFGNLTLSSSD
jgi:hypothetical protein